MTDGKHHVGNLALRLGDDPQFVELSFWVEGTEGRQGYRKNYYLTRSEAQSLRDRLM
jgi:hypothetical protein